VADSDALRARRHRLHKAGNHGLCRPGCSGRARKPPETAADGTPPDLDPGRSLVELAGSLRDAHQADPGNAMLAREYRLTLQALGPGEKVDGELAEMFAAFRGA
jgi:hypothetical protein